MDTKKRQRQIAYYKKWRKDPVKREIVRVRAKNHSAEIRKFIFTLKTEKGCSRCPERYPWALDFHHRDPKRKDSVIAKLKSKKRILLEIKKCIILCSNCHRKAHWGPLADKVKITL